MKPHEIEQKSFKIIDKEAGQHTFNTKEWNIVRRMIHTSADFGYMQSVRIHKDAIGAGIRALCKGRNIITDTEMLRAGIRKKSVEKFGGQTICLINDSNVINESSKQGTTRSHEAVNLALEQMNDGIYAIGNAPTALLHLISLCQEQKANPALIIGLPVGFVNAEESKSLLTELRIPYITNMGRKGGSNVAASVVNALIVLSEQEEKGNNDFQ
ncbi:MAG: precorrin-8X methylmutase [Candidatus Magnetoglobus multicellularis str. Araruama]|uniref:Precorrin-8X methylmutase n=1 Tax=Candidatus Magnetoglobus multicellularis str. Araruama TaxID=890399 RepID=A0A1V1NXP8_9BACT|nr:MAG: precorrin-8X methylmutase [Candidatus Magnetoglobus multicellularis str. Araruama]